MHAIAATQQHLCESKWLERWAVPFVLVLFLFASLSACGLEPDGSHKARSSQLVGGAAAGSLSEVGRYRTEAVRLGVQRPLLLLIDTATGMVLQSNVLGAKTFRPVAEDPAPGGELESKIPGRYDVKVVPGRRGSALLRLDTLTGQTWFLQLSSTQQRWSEITSSLDAEAEEVGNESPPRTGSTAERGRGSSQRAVKAGSKEPASEPPAENLLEVLTKSEYETDLRIWTAQKMADLYPARAVEFLGTRVASEAPKVAVALIERLELDTDASVRSALESHREHEEPTIARAVRKKLDQPDG